MKLNQIEESLSVAAAKSGMSENKARKYLRRRKLLQPFNFSENFTRHLLFRNAPVADPMREAASSYDVVGYPEFWVSRDNVLNVEETNTLLHDIDIEVRLHMIIDGKKRGYFVCFGANKNFTELWFHSED